MKEEKKLVPKRRFKGFEAEWRKFRLSDIANIIGGGTPSTTNKKYWNGNIDWYSPSEIGKEVYVNNSEKKITRLGLQNSSATILPANRTILFTSRAGIGDMAILARDAATNQGFQSLVLKDKYDVYFTYSMGYKIKEYALINASGSTFMEISGKDLGKMEVIFPAFEEQQKIGKFFKLLDKRIANQERKIAKIMALKSAYLTEMFPQEGETVPKRRFKEFKGEWKEVELGHALKYEQPTNYIVKNENYDDRYNTPVLTAGQSFILGFTNEKQGIKQANSNNPVIIFDDFTTSSHFVEFPFKVKSSALKILIPDTSAYDSYFIFQSLKNIKYVPQSHERHWISIFSKFIIRKPKLEEQQKIGQFFKNLDDQIATEERKLAKLKAMKEAYLEEMFV